MKNVKTYDEFKKIIGGSKLALAGAGLGATLLMTGCSGCSVQPEPESSSIEIEVSEVPSEIEIIETSEPVEEEIELPEFPILNEDGTLYNPDYITLEQFNDKIKQIEEIAESDYERNAMIRNMAMINKPWFSSDAVHALWDAYPCDPASSATLFYSRDWNKEEIPFSFYFIDERMAKEMDKYERLMEYLNDDNVSSEKKEETLKKIMSQIKEANKYETFDSMLPLGFWYYDLGVEYLDNDSLFETEVLLQQNYWLPDTKEIIDANPYLTDFTQYKKEYFPELFVEEKYSEYIEEGKKWDDEILNDKEKIKTY